MYFKDLMCPRTIVNIIHLVVTIKIDLFYLLFYLNFSQILACKNLSKTGAHVQIFHGTGTSFSHILLVCCTAKFTLVLDENTPLSKSAACQTPYLGEILHFQHCELYM